GLLEGCDPWQYDARWPPSEDARARRFAGSRVHGSQSPRRWGPAMARGSRVHRGEGRAPARLVAWHVRALRAATWLAVPGAVTRLPQALASQAEAEEGLGHIERAGRLLDEATARVRDLEPDDGTARGLRWRHDGFHREHAGQA